LRTKYATSVPECPVHVEFVYDDREEMRPVGVEPANCLRKDVLVALA